MRGEEDGDADREERIEVSRGSARDRQEPCKQEAVPNEYEPDADEPPLLGECGENEVRLVFRKEAEFRLSAVADTLSEDFSRADGDHGLIRVIASAPDIG